VQFVLDSDFVPDDLYDTYASVAEDGSNASSGAGNSGALRQIRLHGDCHAGNVLWTDEGPHFSSTSMTRAWGRQDLWMCLSGDRKSQQTQLMSLLEGYCEFREFDANELMLIEALRTLRMVHYAGWLARRWDDPAFPASFPFFNTQHYWQDHILSLREQAAALDEAPLRWLG
jgi:Ser/Thr protein kinase RdoA (MazF antagonist)